MLTGEKVYLAAIEKEDLKQLKDWRNIPYFRKHFREFREISDTMQEKWYQDKVLHDQSTIMFSIRRIEDDMLLGCCGLCYINWIHRNADLSLYIGWNDTYIDDNGFAEESCKLLFDYGFGELGLNKIWTEIYEFDNKKKSLFDKIGLKLDGILRENYYHGNRWWDSYIMSILRKDYC